MRFFVCKKGFPFLLIIFPIILFADINQKLVTDQAIERQIYNSHAWHRLLHLDQSNAPLINSKTFLLSHDKFSSKNEMVKTINSFFEDNQSICKYPARFYWLKNELNLNSDDFPIVDCKSFNKYLEKTNPINLKLVFVSEQVKSPSSMMGHTFFKLEGVSESNQKRENAVSFFTVIDTVNIPYLILKSTIIGMKGFFILSPYKNQKNRYLNEEERNIWEYDLNLTNYQKKLIYYHFWELKDLDITYLFTGFNCATIVDDMLGIADKNYKNDFSLWITPKDVIKKANNHHLLGKSELVPSNVWTLNMLSEALPNDKTDEIEHLISTKRLNEIKKYSFSENEKIKQLEIGLFRTYSEYLQQNSNNFFSKQEQDNLNVFLDEQEKEHYIDLSKYKNPIKTFDDTQFAIGYQKSFQQEGITLGFLPASNTLYDDNREYFSESSLKIGEFTLLLQPDAVKIDSASIFAMQSLIPWNSLTKSLSNDFKLNYEKQYTEKLNEYHAFNLSGGIGISKKIHEDVMLFGLLDVGLSYGNNHLYPYLYPHLGLMIYEIFNMKSVLEYKYFYNQNNSHSGYHNFNIEQSVFLDKKYRIGLNYNRKNSAFNSLNSFGISFNYFF